MDFVSKKKMFFSVMFLVLSTPLKIYAAELTPKKLKYSINFICINRRLNKDQLYVYSSKNKENLGKEDKGSQKGDAERDFLHGIYEWAEEYQGSVVNVWYDGELNSKDAVKNTQALIDFYVMKNPKSAKIVLRDVREIPTVKKYPDVFSDKIPVYFRVDLLRTIIALYMLSDTHEIDYFVYGDLDLCLIRKERLFDAETLQKLEKYGIVMAYDKKTPLGFENGFQIISNNNKHLLEAMEFALIQLNIKGVCGMLELLKKKNLDIETGWYISPQAIYFSYPHMFQYFYYLEGYGKLEVPTYIFGTKEIEWDEETIVREKIKTGYRDYNKDKDGLDPFWISHFDNLRQYGRPDELRFTPDNKKLTSPERKEWTWVPTKIVKLPPSAGHFH